MDVAYLDIKSGVLILSYFIVGCIKLLLTCKGNYKNVGESVDLFGLCFCLGFNGGQDFSCILH